MAFILTFLTDLLWGPGRRRTFASTSEPLPGETSRGEGDFRCIHTTGDLLQARSLTKLLLRRKSYERYLLSMILVLLPTIAVNCLYFIQRTFACQGETGGNAGLVPRQAERLPVSRSGSSCRFSLASTF